MFDQVGSSSGSGLEVLISQIRTRNFENSVLVPVQSCSFWVKINCFFLFCQKKTCCQLNLSICTGAEIRSSRKVTITGIVMSFLSCIFYSMLSTAHNLKGKSREITKALWRLRWIVLPNHIALGLRGPNNTALRSPF